MKISQSMAAKYLERTIQALYAAARKGHLKSYRVGGRVFYERDDLDEYAKNRYNRHKTSKDHGMPIFNNQKGIYSVPQLAKYLQIPQQKIYYMIRAGQLPFTRHRSALIIDINSCKAILHDLSKSYKDRPNL